MIPKARGGHDPVYTNDRMGILEDVRDLGGAGVKQGRGFVG